MRREKTKDGSTVLTTGLTLLDVYPVGSIYMAVVDTDPGTLFGGSWTAWGSGRVPTGVDVGQTEFDTVEETGGSKTHTLTTAQMPTHSHTINHDHETKSGTGGTANSAFFMRTGSTGELENGNLVGPATISDSGNAGSGNAHPILQPYITCYMWKRTA